MLSDSINENNYIPFIVEKDGIIQDVSDAFVSLTGFEKKELNSKHRKAVWQSFFRANTDIAFINTEVEIILFTKSLEVRFVTVSTTEDKRKGETTYSFIEKPNSRLENKLPFVEKLIHDGKFGMAIYTAQDFTLLKANQMYLNYIPSSFNTKEVAYGKQVTEFFPHFKDSHGERELRRIVQSNETLYLSELKGLWCGSDDRYWDNTIVPIVEDGDVKYIVSLLYDVTERVLSRERARLKNEQLETIFNSVSDIICIVDKDGNYISGNELSKKIFNLYIENLSSTKKYFKMFDCNEKELDINEFSFANVLKGKEIENVRVNIELNGETKCFKVSGKSIYGKGKEVAYVVFVLQDITEEVKRIKTIEQQNRELQAIIDNSYNCIAVIDKYGNIKRKNKAFKEMYCRKMNKTQVVQKVGDTLKCGEKYYNTKDEEIALQDLPAFRISKGENIKEERIIIKKGSRKSYIDFDGIPVYDEDGNFEMGIMFARDITELMQSYNKIEAQKKELDTIFENMSDGLFVVDKDGKIIKRNKAFEKVGRELFDDKNSLDYVDRSKSYGWKNYDEDGKELPFNELPFNKVLRGEFVKQQRIMSTRGNTKYYVDFSCTPIFDERGNFQYGIVLGHDITENIEKENKIKEQQQLLYKSEKSQREILEKALIMKDEFISLISHEFKTPLNVIYSAIQLIEYMYSNELTERVNELIKSIKQNTFRQLRLVNNLLDITRLKSGRLKLNMKNIDIIYLTKMIVESVRLYVEQKNLKLTFKTNINSKIIAVDEEKYERILLNLISNAIKFTSCRGSITVDVKVDRLLNTVYISVIDTGIGIPKEKQELIFERFGQVESSLSRQAEGTGIGLSLVKLMVDAVGGKINVKSQLGVGSVFEVTLPVKECIENKQNGLCLNDDNRLINAINVEFSDIYF